MLTIAVAYPKRRSTMKLPFQCLRHIPLLYMASDLYLGRRQAVRRRSLVGHGTPDRRQKIQHIVRLTMAKNFVSWRCWASATVSVLVPVQALECSVAELQGRQKTFAT